MEHMDGKIEPPTSDTNKNTVYPKCKLNGIPASFSQNLKQVPVVVLHIGIFLIVSLNVSAHAGTAFIHVVQSKH